MGTILVGFDGTGPAGRALARAAELAEALGSKLVVAAVASPPLPSMGLDAALPGAAPERLAAQSVNEVDQVEARLEQARGLLAGRSLEAEYVSDFGAPAERLVALAEEHGADLIAVGAGDAGFLERLLEGSVSDDVSHHTRRDVLLVH